MKKAKAKPALKNSLTILLLCVGFLLASLAFMLIMTQKNLDDSTAYLNNAVAQKHISFKNQVSGDFQTLRGIAECIANNEKIQISEFSQVLKKINDGNTFIRMGFAFPDGQVNLFDLSGETHMNVDLSELEFFRESLLGKETFSNTLKDPFTDQYINYYAVPVYRESEIAGVLCAVNSSSVYKEMIDAPLLNSIGFSNIIDAQETFMFRSTNTIAEYGDPRTLEALGTLNEENREIVNHLIDENLTGSFDITIQGTAYRTVLMPLGINNWYLLSSVPKSALWQNYWVTTVGTIVIVFSACAIFLYLLNRQHKMMEGSQKALQKLAYEDSLIGCRSFPKLLLDAQSVITPQTVGSYAFWYCDLKKFKYFNDLFGYDAGDQMLQKLASLIEKTSGTDSLFCRISADNFAGLRPYNSREELIKWFEALHSGLQMWEYEHVNRLHIELCAGFFCPGPEDGELTVQDMIDRANMAQKSVKAASESQYAFYTKEIRKQILENSELEALGKAALEAGEFLVYMQPKIDIQHGARLAGAEALVRWKNAQRGLISPGDFIPLFEKTGLIVHLDRYMFREVCKWYRRYLDEGRPPLNIAVNVSRLGLLQDDFVEFYSAIKGAFRIPDEMLELEFTESIILEDNELFNRTVRALQSHGFICSLDDFGTGYSSLNILKNLPIDVLKLDMLFFQKSIDVKREQVIISHIVAMAKELKLKTVAEGVETKEQADFLVKAGCDFIQGYLFAKPMPLPEFTALEKELLDKPFPLPTGS